MHADAWGGLYTCPEIKYSGVNEYFCIAVTTLSDLLIISEKADETNDV